MRSSSALTKQTGASASSTIKKGTQSPPLRPLRVCLELESKISRHAIVACADIEVRLDLKYMHIKLWHAVVGIELLLHTCMVVFLVRMDHQCFVLNSYTLSQANPKRQRLAICLAPPDLAEVPRPPPAVQPPRHLPCRCLQLCQLLPRMLLSVAVPRR